MFQPSQLEGRYCSPLGHLVGGVLSALTWLGTISAHDSRALSQPMTHWTYSQPSCQAGCFPSPEPPVELYTVYCMLHTWGFGHYSSPPHLRPLCDRFLGVQLGLCFSPVSWKGDIAAHSVIWWGAFFQPSHGWALSQPMTHGLSLSP